MTDLEIAKKATIQPIKQIAAKLNLDEDTLEPYGKYIAKLPLSLIDEKKVQSSSLILVSAITPTPAGEGKTTVSIGLTDGLNRIGKKAIAALREPSLGPVFGIKGGAAGGGYSQVIPMENINLHFTGDFSAIEKANNLLAALIDNNLQNKKNSLGINPNTLVWKRVMDMNDRALRNMVIGLGGAGNGLPREDGFNITAASEIMAILCLSKNFADLKNRIAKIYIGRTHDGSPVYARDLKAENALCILLKDAIKPNLVQTLEGNPAILHGGPFANIAQGTNSIIATKMGLSLADYVVTEAGFGADLGAEKFLNIKCVAGNLKPKAMVLVATIRALRHHGGAEATAYNTPDLEKVKIGFANLAKHIENCRKFGLNPVVALNAFPNDSAAEQDFLNASCAALGTKMVVSEGWAKGGLGTMDLAQAVVDSIESGKNAYNPLFEATLPVKDKIETIAREIYGADGVAYSNKAKTALNTLEKMGWQQLAVCMAKTQKSFSDNESLRNTPKDFIITVRDFEFATGAGFVIPILGDMMRMPGLPAIPASEGMFIDEDGEISGLA